MPFGPNCAAFQNLPCPCHLPFFDATQANSKCFDREAKNNELLKYVSPRKQDRSQGFGAKNVVFPGVHALSKILNRRLAGTSKF